MFTFIARKNGRIKTTIWNYRHCTSLSTTSIYCCNVAWLLFFFFNNSNMFFCCSLFVDEAESIRRQLFRGEHARLHNAKVGPKCTHLKMICLCVCRSKRKVLVNWCLFVILMWMKISLEIDTSKTKSVFSQWMSKLCLQCLFRTLSYDSEIERLFHVQSYQCDWIINWSSWTWVARKSVVF